MNTVKKIMALITIILVVIRLFVINVSASFAAPIMAEETLKTALIEGLVAGGADYTKDDLEAWELDDLENEFQIQMNTNPNFKPKEAAPKIFPFIPFSDTVLGEFLAKREQVGYDWYDSVHPTLVDPGFDMHGGTAILVYDNTVDSNGKVLDTVVYILNDYGYRAIRDGDGFFTAIRANTLIMSYHIDETGKKYNYTYYDPPYSSGTLFGLNTFSGRLHYYGDWRFENGESAETDDEVIPVIGEVAGTQVTPDMLNPDGTVTIDGTTYSPTDFIDWDKFKDNAIIDLLNDILKELENVPVIDDSKTDIDEIDSDVDLPSELSDFAIPGLIDVFPFCLPKHFIRGMYLFSTEPEVPHFETEIKIPAFLNVPEQNWKIEIDFKEFEPLAKITRWCSLISFIYCLILLTPKIAKGA